MGVWLVTTLGASQSLILIGGHAGNMCRRNRRKS
jgi:hypothetical protein